MTLVVLGLVVGVLSGVLGLGGGIFLVPALIYLYGMTPQQAAGTSLAVLIPPIGIFAALEYWRRGYIQFGTVGLICAGFIVGAYAGALVVAYVPVPLMRRLFGFFLFFMAVQRVFTDPSRRVGSIFPSALGTGLLAVVYLVENRLGLAVPRLRRWLERRRPKGPLIEYNI
jgi:uncharacterized membrane protein YfcA